MSIRPYFKVIVGFDNAKPKEDINEDCEEFLYGKLDIKQLYTDDPDYNGTIDIFITSIYCIGDIVYNPQGIDDHSIEGLVGVEVPPQQNMDEEIAYALMTCFPQFQKEGYIIFPNLNPQENNWRYKMYKYDDNDIKCGRFFQYETFATLLRYEWLFAKIILNKIGWDIKEDQLRKMLVWGWS